MTEKFRCFINCAYGAETLPAASRFLGLVKTGTFKSRLIVMGTGGNIPVYLDTVAAENAVGFLMWASVTPDGAITKAELKKQFLSAIKADACTFADIKYTENPAVGVTAVCTLNPAADADVTVEAAKASDSLLSKAQSIAQSVGLTAESAAARIHAMEKNHFSEAVMTAVVNRWEKIPGYNDIAPTEYIDPDLNSRLKTGKRGVLEELTVSVLLGYAVLLRGPKATGKDTAINYVLWLMAMPRYGTVITTQTDAMDVLGSTKTDNRASDAIAHFDTAVLAEADKIRVRHSGRDLPFTEAENAVLLKAAEYQKLSDQAASIHLIHDTTGFCNWLRYGGGYVLDEFNAGDPNMLVGLLNGLLDGSSPTYAVPGAGDIPINPHSVLIATQNDGYAGVDAEQNPATMSRFNAVFMGQPSTVRKILEAAVKGEIKKKGISCELPAAKAFEQASRFYDACKKLVVQGDSTDAGADGSGAVSDACLNVRGLVRAMTQVAMFPGVITLKSAIMNCVINTCPPMETATLTALLNAAIK